jgi:hypothetical protein
VSNTAPIQSEQPVGREILSGSANWALDNGTQMIVDPGMGSPGWTLTQLARVALLLAVSCMTAGPDPWFRAERQRARLTVSTAFQTRGRRRITALEARRLALDILHRAEAGRAAAAEAEAKRGIDWEKAS